MWVLWAAYDLGSFPNLPKGMSKEEYVKYVTLVCSKASQVLVIEDDNKWFREKRGPVCFVTIFNLGWRIEPHADFFMWAKPRSILRCVVSFLHMTRQSKDVGIVEIRALSKYRNLFNRVCEYGVLCVNGKIPDGHPEGDVWLFTLRGMKDGQVNGVRVPKRIQRNSGRRGSAGKGYERRGEIPRETVLRGQERRDSEERPTGPSGSDTERKVSPSIANACEAHS